ncbi:hypothetical protein PG994_005116 [Apiospora phragmitis]|uniref:2EXR domain-containing protein n=1 Tax=Apiospora phragmitis TaxID=2905665 RepID=A0ABR1VST0_9PEZI
MTPTNGQVSIFKPPVIAFASAPKGTTFHPFAELPIELRMLIWRISLQRQRFVTVRLVPGPTHGTQLHYEVKAQRRYRHSKLLRVSQEARRAALEFFTVRIPCSNLGSGGARGEVPLYFSPAYDVLHITASYRIWKYIVDFLPKLAAEWDSRGRGVLHLALDRSLFSYGDPVTANMQDSLYKPAREALTDALARLQRLWIVNLEGGDVRVMSGLAWRHAKCHHNRSVPVFSGLQAFERLPGTDLRPIAADLGQIASFDDPGRAVRLWRGLEAALGVRRSEAKPLELRVLLADKGPNTFRIVDQDTAQRYLEEQETTTWDRVRGFYRPQAPPWGQYLSRQEWEDLSGRLHDAVGFWLFMPEAFEQPPLGDSVGRFKRIRDLRKHPPELCVFDLGP